MTAQELILIVILVLALAYVGYRTYRTYKAKQGGAQCDDCAANAIRNKKTAAQKQNTPS